MRHLGNPVDSGERGRHTGERNVHQHAGLREPRTHRTDLIGRCGTDADDLTHFASETAAVRVAGEADERRQMALERPGKVRGSAHSEVLADVVEAVHAVSANENPTSPVTDYRIVIPAIPQVTHDSGVLDDALGQLVGRQGGGESSFACRFATRIDFQLPAGPAYGGVVEGCQFSRCEERFDVADIDLGHQTDCGVWCEESQRRDRSQTGALARASGQDEEVGCLEVRRARGEDLDVVGRGGDRDTETEGVYIQLRFT